MSEISYAALTGDLVASRESTPSFRRKVQTETLSVLRELNQGVGPDLVAPLALTAGDEIQGLFRAPSRIVEVVQVVKDRLFGSEPPHQDIVFGVGWGPLSTGLLPEAESVEHLDGPCFHLAREALASARKRKTWTVFAGFGESSDPILNSLFELMGALRTGWTVVQSSYITDLRDLGKRIDVARRRGVSPSVVTESLQSSHFEVVRRGEETARQVLTEFDPGGSDR